MPNCFQLTRKTEPQNGAVALARIDAELCEMLAVDCHPVRYVCGWFDYIGFALACGKSFPDIRAQIVADAAKSPRPDETAEYTAARVEFWRQLLAICDYLAEHFTPDCWAEIGRR